MSVRFDGTGEGLRRTANLPAVTAFTMCGWFYIVSAPGGYGYILGVNSGASGWCNIGYNNGTFGIIGNDGNTEANFGSGPSTAAWIFVAIVGNGSGANTLHGRWMNMGASSFNAVSTTNSTFSPSQANVGISGVDAESVSCRAACIKMWDAALTDAELLNEAYSILPRRTANLNVWSPTFPGATERLADYSGNGRNWTALNTLTDEDQPPVSWGGSPIFVSLAGAAPDPAPFEADFIPPQPRIEPVNVIVWA